MLQQYQHPVDETLIRELIANAQWQEAFEALATPLHEALYQAQTFDSLDNMTQVEQLILSLDYIRMQVGQGGFIQLLQNGYAPLLVTAIENAQALNIGPELVKTLDDVLKVYVLNSETLARETTPEEFAKLYNEFTEFEPLNEQFAGELPVVIEQLVCRLL